ncbi:MAG TPA: hypothetical protein DCW73_05030 [Treponema sp.]|nr:hypothetical protein [Treponema sp.]
MRNFSEARKNINSARGIIPFVENTCRQPSEFFRLKKLLAANKRNNSDCQKYASSGCGIIFIEEIEEKQDVRFFAGTKSLG